MQRNNKIEPLIPGDEFTVEDPDSFWNWWANATEYKPGEHLVDLCIMGDCENVKFDIQVDCTEKTGWSMQSIIDICESLYKDNRIELYFEDNGVRVNRIIGDNKILFSKQRLKKFYILFHIGKFSHNSDTNCVKLDKKHTKKSDLVRYFTF